MAYLNEHIFPLLNEILEKLLFKAKDLDCLKVRSIKTPLEILPDFIFKYEKSTFNGIDYISEMLWNLNSRYPERKKQWTKIFNMDWVQYHLSQQ